MSKSHKKCPKQAWRYYRERRAELLERASLLDREADFELQCGHEQAAERLSHQAAELRMQEAAQ